VFRWGFPSFESVSPRGEGIFPALKAICRMSLNSLGDAWVPAVPSNKFRVIITGVEDNGARIAVAERLSSYAKISIDKAEKFLDRVPLVIARNVDVHKADLLKLKFQELGAIILIEPVVPQGEIVRRQTISK